jgi:hypothetical protein
MKHVFNIIGVLTKYLLVIVAMALGLVILPIAVLFRTYQDSLNPESNKEKFSIKWIDKIYGNRWDGFGDIYYKRDFPVDTYWSRLNWCMLRNPTHNLSEDLGVQDKLIIKSVITGNTKVTDDPFEECTGLKIQECWDSEGNYYPMYYYCKLWRQILPFYKGDRGFRLLLGYKNFCVKELDERYTYNFVCAITPFKNFVKG